MRFEVAVSKREQLDAVLHKTEYVKRCYVDTTLCLQEEHVSAVRALASTGTEVYAAMPYMTREEAGTPDIADLKELCAAMSIGDADEESARLPLTGVLVRNTEQLAFFAEADYKGRIVTDAQLYMWNAQAIRELTEDARLSDKLCGYTLPLEESVHQWKETLSADTSGLTPSVLLYGRVPMMVSAGCVLQTMKGCTGKRGAFYKEYTQLEDRTGRKLPVECSCRYCYNVIRNAYPLSLHKAYLSDALPEALSYRLEFTTESGKELEQILQFFGHLQTASDEPPFTEYTTGRFQKGVD